MIDSASAYVHFYNRGVNKDLIFFAPENYIYLLAKMSEYMINYRVELIAYCLMPNHYHILLKHEEQVEGSRFMQRLFNGYTQAMNKKYNRVGTLFQGNVKKRIIDSDDYLLETIKYIHLNPVKAGLCQNPEDWDFSDFREWIGLNECSRNIAAERDNIFGTAKDYADLIHLEY